MYVLMSEGTKIAKISAYFKKFQHPGKHLCTKNQTKRKNWLIFANHYVTYYDHYAMIYKYVYQMQHMYLWDKYGKIVQ